MCCLEYKFGIRFLPKNEVKNRNKTARFFIFKKTDRFLMSRKPKFFKTEKTNQSLKKPECPALACMLNGFSESTNSITLLLLILGKECPFFLRIPLSTIRSIVNTRLSWLLLEKVEKCYLNHHKGNVQFQR